MNNDAIESDCSALGRSSDDFELVRSLEDKEIAVAIIDPAWPGTKLPCRVGRTKSAKATNWRTGRHWS
jgi:hypothetical protein